MTLSHETLRERILTGGGGSVTARGSLAKVASRYADFLDSLLPREQKDDVGGGGGGEGDDRYPAPSAIEAARALETELRLHDLDVRKSALSYRAHIADSSRCANAASSLESKLSNMKDDVERLRDELIQERATRRRREEYDALARMGTSTIRDDRGENRGGSSSSSSLPPPARTTRMELEDVRREMAKVEAEASKARWELTVREKQMRVVMASLADLGATLGEEEIVRKGTKMTAGGGSGADDDEDARDEKGASVFSSSTTSTTTTKTKAIHGGSKRKRMLEGEGGDTNVVDGDDRQDDCGAI